MSRGVLEAGLPDVEPDDPEGALRQWRRYRRRQRIADIHWVDALYQAYLVAILTSITVLFLSSFIGDAEITSATTLRRIREEGDDIVGIAAAFVIALGLRSGSRGGPLALERAEVRHVLLAPVDRTEALRGPALRQLRFLLFASVLTGAAAGLVAAPRLPHGTGRWVAAGAAFAATTAAAGFAAALLAAGVRMPRWLGTALGAALIGASVADVADLMNGAPPSAIGRIAVWGFGVEAVGVVAAVAVLAGLAVGLALVGNASLEAAERRSSLVGQLRFAATLQDVRTVIVLRRQLAMELPRLRPWIRARAAAPARHPVVQRSLRGQLRWPAARLARAAGCAVTAGIAAEAAYDGTTALAIVAGLALYLIALDAVEPLAQEFDHPSLGAEVPVAPGWLHVRLLVVPIAAMLAVSAVAALAATVMAGEARAAPVAAICIPAAALAAVAAATSAVLPSAAPVGDDASVLLPPEVAGMRLVVRTAWPPAVAVAGMAPVVVAREVASDGGNAVAGAAIGAAGPILVALLVFGWVRVRDDVHAWWRSRIEELQAAPST